MSSEHNEPDKQLLTRREALILMSKGVAAVAAVTVVPQLLTPTIQAKENTTLNKGVSPDENLMEGIGQFATSAVEPTVISQGYGFAQCIIAPFIRRLGLPIGTYISEEKVPVLRSASNEDILSTGVLYGPVYNGVIWVADAISKTVSGGTSLPIKLVVSGLMGLASNAIYKANPDYPQSKEPEFMSNLKVPAFQIADNFFYWQLMKRHGFLPSTLARSMKDVSILLAGKYLHRQMRGLSTSAITMLAPPQAVDLISKQVISKHLGGKRSET